MPPTLTLTPAAREKLQDYLRREPSETAVRVLVEDDGRFGLSLDTRAPDDTGFDVQDIPFVVGGSALPAADGLRIDYLQQGAASGFSLTGGRPPRGAVPVVLRVEPTPNPDAMKLVLSFSLGRQARTWTAADRERFSPAVRELFDIPGVESVFELDNFVTVSRVPGTDWEAIVPRAREALSRLERPEVEAQAGPASDAFPDRLEHFIRTDVAPFLQADGGDIELVGYEERKVKVRLRGACGTCPSAIATLQYGVERRLREQFPDDVDGLVLVGGPGEMHF